MFCTLAINLTLRLTISSNNRHDYSLIVANRLKVKTHKENRPASLRILHKFSSQNRYHVITVQGHPTSKLRQKPLRDVFRLLVIYKDCLKRFYYHLEEFDLFGYFS